MFVSVRNYHRSCPISRHVIRQCLDGSGDIEQCEPAFSARAQRASTPEPCRTRHAEKHSAKPAFAIAGIEFAIVGIEFAIGDVELAIGDVGLAIGDFDAAIVELISICKEQIIEAPIIKDSGKAWLELERFQKHRRHTAHQRPHQ